MTLGQFRAATAALPDDAPLLAEARGEPVAIYKTCLHLMAVAAADGAATLAVVPHVCDDDGAYLREQLAYLAATSPTEG